MAKKSASLEPLKIGTGSLFITGENALIHKFSSKAIHQMLAKQIGKGFSVAGREKREPHMDWVRALYLMPGDRFGFPVRAIKSALVRAFKDTHLSMTDAKTAFFVEGESVPSALGNDALLEMVGVPRLHMAMVRNDNGTADVRFRAEFDQWSARLNFKYNCSMVTHEQLAQACVVAGFGIGLGDDRPQKGGNFGAFRLSTEQDHEAMIARTNDARIAWFKEHAEKIARIRAEDLKLRDLILTDPDALDALDQALNSISDSSRLPKDDSKKKLKGANGKSEGVIA